MQSRILAIWDALRVASSPAADELVKLQRVQTIPIPPVSRLAPSRLDVSARALDVNFGWEMLFEDVIKMPHILSIVSSECGVLFDMCVDVYLHRHMSSTSDISDIARSH